MSISLQQQSRTLWQLCAYVMWHRPGVVIITIIGIVSSAVEVLALASLVPITLLASNQAIPPTSFWYKLPNLLGLAPDARFYAASFIALLLLRAITSTINMMLIARTYRGLSGHFASRALESFTWHLSFEEIQKQSVGHFITLTGDESNRAAQIIMYLMRIVPVLALLVLYLAALLYQSWIFGAALIAFFTLTLICLSQAFRISLRLGRIQQEQARQANTHLLESLNGLRTVRCFNAEPYVSSRYEKMIGDYYWTFLKVDYVNQLSRALPAAVLLILLLVITLSVLDLNWFAQNLSFIFVGVMIAMRMLPLAGNLLDFGMRLLADLRAAENLGVILSAARAKATGGTEAGPPSAAITRIAFENVTFRYSPDTPLVLDNFSHIFEAGKSYAIVGPSGVGKSSMIDLFLKFYAPGSGVIRINQTDAATLPASWIRARVALAEQVTRLFYDTVFRNITFGRTAKRESGQRALRDVGLEDFLATLPKGMDTLLSYQGSNFSGGQRQRIGLARALLEPADVLVIDEGTSALDHATKTAVVDAILQGYRDKIVIFVTHDSAVVDAVDEVISLVPPAQQAAQQADIAGAR